MSPATTAPAQWGVMAGRAVPWVEAIAAAARWLAESPAPAIGGLCCDQEGAAAAVALARRLGAVLDHAHAEALLRDLAPMSGPGWVGTTPLVARAMADTALLIGPGAALPFAVAATIHIGSHAGLGGNALSELGAIRAALAGRPYGGTDAARYQAIAEQLRRARYGVAVWSAEHLDALAIESAAALVVELNETTRFAALPVPPPGNAAGVGLALASLCGFPARVQFGADRVRHDPHGLALPRLLARGDVETLLWVAPLGAAVPAHGRRIVIGPAESEAAESDCGGEIVLLAGVPGRDHNAVLHDAETGQLRAFAASAPSEAPSAAAILRQIAGALPC
jgi:formylmethanofuran dehydrogenase subunit B